MRLYGTNDSLWERALPYTLAALVAAVILSRMLERAAPPTGVLLVAAVLALCWLAWEIYRGLGRFFSLSTLETSGQGGVGLGLALLGATALLLRLTGGLTSPFYPLLYLLIAFLATFGSGRQGVIWFGYGLTLEMVGVLASGLHNPGVVGVAALHLVFLSLAAGSHHLYLRGVLLVTTRHRSFRQQREEGLALSSPLLEAEDRGQGMTRISFNALEQDRQVLLSLLKEGLDAHGCALLWISADDQMYEVTGIQTDAAEFALGPFALGAGAPAGLFKGGTPLRLSRTSDSGIRIPYYPEEIVVRSMLAVPLRQKGALRGALCADRIHAAPFSAREEAMMEAAAVVFGRALESERSFRRSDRDLQDLAQLQQATQRLNATLTAEELSQEVLRAAALFAPYDWGFVSRYHSQEDSHTILAAKGEASPLAGQKLTVGTSLLSLAFKHGCPLPEKGILRSRGPYIAEPDPDIFPPANSLYLLPLILKDKAIGCLALGAQQPDLFNDEELEKNLGTLANQLAALMENANYYQQLQELAQLDGLTNLYNHRYFMESFEKTLCAARRYPKKVTLLLLDLDHFKRVNDTYGHPVGDRVLRAVSRLLHESARETDLVARYGGEEFAIVMDETTADGALKLADRIRRKAARLRFFSDEPAPKEFAITVSMGLATFPDHGRELPVLLRNADQALYEAKHRGRNRAILFSSSWEGVGTAASQPPAEDSPHAPPKGWGWGSLPPYSESDELQDPRRWSWTPETPRDTAISEPHPPRSPHSPNEHVE